MKALVATLPLCAALLICNFTASGKKAKPDTTSVTELESQQLTQAHSALKIISDWRGEQPISGQRTLKIAYWSPADRAPQPEYQQRLSTILKDIEGFYRKEMQRNGFGSLSLKFDKDAKDSIQIIPVTGKKNYSEYNVQSGREILSDVAAEMAKHGVDTKTETVVIFCNMSNWDAEKRTVNQNSPYYAWGHSSAGAAWQVDSPILNLADLTNMKDRVRDGQYGDITLGKYNTIFIGGVAHELGHAFGLPHTKERPDEEQFGIALMGNGNRAYGNDLRKDGKPAFLSFGHALRLATHPMFSGVTQKMTEPVSFGYEDLKYGTDGENVIITGRVKSNIPTYAVIAYADPEIGQDYDAMNHVTIPDTEGNFTIKCPIKNFDRYNGKGNIRLVSYFANGACTANNSAITKGQMPYEYSKETGISLGHKQKQK